MLFASVLDPMMIIGMYACPGMTARKHAHCSQVRMMYAQQDAHPKPRENDLRKMEAKTSESDSANLTNSASSGGLLRRNELVSNLRGAKRGFGEHFPTVLISSLVLSSASRQKKVHPS